MIFCHLYNYSMTSCSFILQKGWLLHFDLYKYGIMYTILYITFGLKKYVNIYTMSHIHLVLYKYVIKELEL
jgi:hypothetical protein